MYILANIVFLLVAIAILVYVIRHTSEWARRTQKKDVEHAQAGNFTIGSPERWGSGFMFNIIRFGIVFSTVILMLIAYSLLLGTH